MVKNLNTVDQGRNVRHGFQSGFQNQSPSSIAVGHKAGHENQNGAAVAIGYTAGYVNQGSNSIAVGLGAGEFKQGINSIAVGSSAGSEEQQQESIAIGVGAGYQGQMTSSIAVGPQSAYIHQGSDSIAIGKAAGYSEQNTSSIAIGTSAGRFSAGIGSVAIGSNAGYSNMGDYSIAVGAGGGFYSNPNTITLNASGDTLNAPTSNAFYVKPIRFSSSLSANTLAYVASTGEIIERDTLSFDNKGVLIGPISVAFPRVHTGIVKITPPSLYPQTEVALEVGGIIENTVAGGSIILKSPNGTRYAIKVSDGGALSTSTA